MASVAPGRTPRAVLAVLVVVVTLALPGVGAAQDRSLDGAAAADLARAAITDDDALAELRDVRTVDGRSVDLAAATADLGSARADRLENLADVLGGPDAGAGGGGPVGPSSAEARESAQRVLDDDKFHETEMPRPFKGVLELLATPLRPVGRFLQRLVEPILDLPGGAFILAALLGGTTAALVAWMIGRRSRAAVVRAAAATGLVDLAADPEELDRRATAAEADGRFDLAVRFRYEAGLVRLVRLDRLVLRPDTTPADAARQVSSPVMDHLTADFEEVVYGGRPATASDAELARSGWMDLLAAGSRR